MKYITFSILLTLWMCQSLVLAETTAKAVDEKYIWDLTEIYPSDKAWNNAREKTLEDIAKLEKRKGNLGDSANSLYNTLQMVSDITRSATRVYAYASMKNDEDLRVTQTQEQNQLGGILFARFGEATAWIQPEILSVGRQTIESFVKQDDRLSPFAFYLDDALRQSSHTLGKEAEETLANFSQTFAAPNDIYSLIANSDIPWPEVTLSNGEKHRIDSQGYGRGGGSDKRDDRNFVFDTFWTKWSEYRSSVGMVMNSHIQTQVSLAKARHYDSVLERELFEDNLPVAVYRTLVDEVSKALPTLHRYFKLRTRMLGLKQMHYYDIYPPLVSMDKVFDIETSNAITLDAMSILGDDWVSKQKAAMAERWVHVYPKRGKRSGAYMQPAAYDVHPYLLLNHNDDYDSLSTLAHEWGHAMHSVYAKESQPYETTDYATFIAEIPSTSLELILQDYMTSNTKSINEKIYYLGSGLESMRSTFFRQTMFAEFELAMYETAERGEALSGEKISAIYGDILKRYHGHDEGVVIIDDLYTNEWMFVPHFYYNMYVFQYATSQTAGTALYSKILEQGKEGVDNYKNLLRAGGSDYPYQLLLDAGVDMAKPEPYRAVIKKMNGIMDELEALLDKRDN